jgi:hypothetical protein
MIVIEIDELNKNPARKSMSAGEDRNVLDLTVPQKARIQTCLMTLKKWIS